MARNLHAVGPGGFAIMAAVSVAVLVAVVATVNMLARLSSAAADQLPVFGTWPQRAAVGAD